MKPTMFMLFKVLVAAVIAAVVAVSVSTGNAYLPGVVILAGALVLWLMKRKVTGVTEDERDRKVAGHAALVAMSIYAVGAAAVGTTVVALGKDDPVFYAVGSTLLYGTSVFVVLYAVLFKVYAKREDKD